MLKKVKNFLILDNHWAGFFSAMSIMALTETVLGPSTPSPWYVSVPTFVVVFFWTNWSKSRNTETQKLYE